MSATNADDTRLDTGFGMLLSHNMILYGVIKSKVFETLHDLLLRRLEL